MRPCRVTVDPSHGPSVLSVGVGTTAASEADARAMFAAAFKAAHRIARVRAVVAADELDPRPVAPNTGNTLKRGVWFPLGYDHPPA